MSELFAFGSLQFTLSFAAIALLASFVYSSLGVLMNCRSRYHKIYMIAQFVVPLAIAILARGILSLKTVTLLFLLAALTGAGNIIGIIVGYIFRKIIINEWRTMTADSHNSPPSDKNRP